VSKSPRYPDAEEVPDTVLINPVLMPLSDEMEEGWEGCLSVPGMRGLVPRHASLRYTASTSTATPSTALCKASTPVSCSTNATTDGHPVPDADTRLEQFWLF